jgi:hypothetical protein
MAGVGISGAKPPSFDATMLVVVAITATNENECSAIWRKIAIFTLPAKSRDRRFYLRRRTSRPINYERHLLTLL